MDTVDWDAFLKGWQGQTPTSPTSSSESKLLTSSLESEGSISLSKSSSEPFTEPLVEFLVESAGPRLISREDFNCRPFGGDKDDSVDPPLSPETGKDQHPDK